MRVFNIVRAAVLAAAETRGVQVSRVTGPLYEADHYMTMVMLKASNERNYDFLLPLDADEFLVARGVSPDTEAVYWDANNTAALDRGGAVARRSRSRGTSRRRTSPQRAWPGGASFSSGRGGEVPLS